MHICKLNFCCFKVKNCFHTISSSSQKFFCYFIFINKDLGSFKTYLFQVPHLIYEIPSPAFTVPVTRLINSTPVEVIDITRANLVPAVTGMLRG